MNTLNGADTYITTRLPSTFPDLKTGERIAISARFKRHETAWIVLQHPRLPQERIFAIDWILPDPNHPLAIIRPALVAENRQNAYSQLTAVLIDGQSAQLIEQSELDGYLAQVGSISEMLGKPRLERERWSLEPAIHLLGQLNEWSDDDPAPSWLQIDTRYLVDGIRVHENEVVKIRHKIRDGNSFYLYLSNPSAMDTDDRFVAEWLDGNTKETFLSVSRPHEELEGLNSNCFLIFEIEDESTLRVPSSLKICEQAKRWFDSSECGRSLEATDIQRIFGAFTEYDA